MKVNDIIIENANFVLNNDINPGHNGPYHNQETRVRVYSHWSIVLLKAYEITKNESYKDKAKELLEYLFSKEARPNGYTFYHRKKGKDKCNGLIGQAWSIEALMYAHNVLKNNKYKELAKKVFLLHKQSSVTGYWKKVEINGKELFLDTTFNHQLWFAMSGSLIEDNQIEKHVSHFMDRLDINIKIHKNGLIKHLIFPNITTPIYLLKNKLTNSRIDKKYLYEKEIGYHAFNCYALAILNKKYPNNKFWSSKKFAKILNFTISKEHFKISETNKYGFSYNPSGIETAFFVQHFKKKINNYLAIIINRLDAQIKRNLDKKTKLLRKNAGDPETLSSRIYEMIRIDNLEV